MSSAHLPDLPVVEALPALDQALADPGRAVLVAPPGAGKTTLVPLHLLDAPWRDDGTLLVLEPRRLAARAAAHRMAELLGDSDVGGRVGYRIRHDTRVGRHTRVEVVTEGVLTRMLQSDPALSGVALVAFDEFHERSLHADVGLALALQSAQILRPDLRILVMSATLDTGPVSELLGGAPVVASEGRSWAVETTWLDRPLQGHVEPAAARAVREALATGSTGVLVFLPGAGEIRRTAGYLDDLDGSDGVSVHPLSGSLTRQAQDRALAAPGPGRRKVVLATAIAETSLTIEGVDTVVDAGLMRVPRFDPGTGMTRLVTQRVTRDSADQRRGRAGRTGPGRCFRLWTRDEDRGLVARRRPEILEADLAPVALELAAWGAEPGTLAWLDPPPEAAHAQAVELLQELEALDDARAVTSHGRALLEPGLHPRLAHMLLRGAELGHGPLACDLAALLSDRDPIRAEGGPADADLRLRLESLRSFRAGGRVSVPRGGHRAHRGGLARAAREARHLRRALGLPRDAEWAPEDVERAGLLTALAYPDRVGQARPGAPGRFRLRSGRGASLPADQPGARWEWLAVAHVDGRGRDARIFLAAPLARDEIEALFTPRIREAEEVVWDPDVRRVVARRVRTLGSLLLEEGPLPSPPPHRVAQALVEGVAAEGLDALPWSDETRQLLDRLRFLHRLDPERWPDYGRPALEAELGEWLEPFVPGMRSLEDLRGLDLAAALLSRAEPGVRGHLDTQAPTHMEVPSGSRIRLDYSDPDAPVLAVRLQEMFGLEETPRIAGGRVPLTLHLLSPAHRPVQVTRDLASFWKDAYFEVRKDLRGRYPKHFWPDDPLEAPATRRTRPSR